MKVAQLRQIISELPEDLDIKLDISQGVVWNVSSENPDDRVKFVYSDTSNVVNLTIDRLEVIDNALHIYAGLNTENFN